MNSEDNYYTEIEAYMNNTMNASERTAFEKALNENPELAEEVEINRQMQLQYDENSWSFARKNTNNPAAGALEQYLRSNEAQATANSIKNAGDHYRKHTARMRRKKIFYYAAASVILLFLAGNFLMKPPASEQLYADYKNWKELTSLTVRGDDANALSEGEQLFKQEKYAEAITIFNTYLEENTTTLNTQVLIYLGGAYLESEQYEKALDIFNRLLNSNTADSPKAYWYKALTFLKQDDKENAKQQLEILIANPGFPYFKEGKELKHKLNSPVLYRIFGSFITF